MILLAITQGLVVTECPWLYCVSFETVATIPYMQPNSLEETASPEAIILFASFNSFQIELHIDYTTIQSIKVIPNH